MARRIPSSRQVILFFIALMPRFIVPAGVDGRDPDEREGDRRPFREDGLREEATELTSVGVAFNRDVEKSEFDGRGVADGLDD